MGLTPADYVPLDRRFERGGLPDDHDYWAEILADGETPRDWSWLRAQSRVIALLAQAGSGKTVEFQHQVDEARKAGRQAFFFRVERLCTGTIDDAHETLECKASFERWLAGNGDADFFLDSVDEAKLPQSRTARPLRDAVATLMRAIDSHLGRSAVLVSCRSSEWFDDVEQRAIEDLASAMSARSAGAEPIAVFNASFAPLDRSRIRLLAEARDAGDAMEILDASEAIADIVTPLDAILYLDTYREFRGTDDLLARFGSRGALLETSVRRRLSEEGGEMRRSQLDFSAAHRAAQFLAVASITAQTMDISTHGLRKDCIDPGELLAGGHAGLAPDSIRQLLACSLFVPAGQGRIRFYRPEARAMLAAQWLRDRIEEGASPLKVGNQFIRTIFRTDRVPAAYGSMFAWLASYEPVTRRRMIMAAPEWIIEDGDPRSLALEDRIAALRQHFNLGPNRFAGEFYFEHGAMRRFATPELEVAVVAELAALPPGDLLDQAMQFCQAGRYASAAPLLVEILLDIRRGAGAKMFAIGALRTCGSQEDLRRVALDYIATGGPYRSNPTEPFAASRNDSVIIDLVTATYPGTIAVAEALALLSQLRGKDHSAAAKSFALWAQSIPDTDLEAWWVGLDTLCFEPDPAYRPFGHDRPKMTRRATLLVRSFGDIAARYIDKGGPFDFSRDLLIYDRIRHIRHLGTTYGVSRRGSPLPAALMRTADFRVALYERLAEAERKRGTAFTYQEHLSVAAYRDTALSDDLAWLTQRYRDGTPDERDDYAQSYLMLSEMYGVAKRKRLTLAWAALAQRRPDWRLVKAALITPLLKPWYAFRRRFRYDVPDKILRAWCTRLAANVRCGIAIARNWRGLRTGTADHLLVHLILDGSAQGPSEDELHARFGRSFGNRLIAGVKAFARTHRPINRGRWIEAVDIAGKLGLDYIWNEDRSMTGVDPAEALRAALFHATDWPDWGTDLALRYPRAWIDVAVPLLTRELEQAHLRDVDLPGPFFSTIAFLEESIRAILSEPLFEAIQCQRVIDAIDIDRLGRILRTDPAMESRTVELARLRAREAWHEGAVKRAMAWLPLWLPGDEAGLDTLLAWMAADPELIEDGLSLYARCYGRSEGPRLTLPALDVRIRLAMLAYQAIDPKDDAPAREGVHTSTRRDDLQHLRSDVGELLSADYDDAERAALEQLLTTCIEPISRDWAERWRNRYERNAAKPGPWSHAQIVAMGHDLTAAPASGQTLLDRVAELVGDLQTELARSEFDRRGLFSPSILEADFRSWLGHALDGRRRPWFSIVQEAETANEARTDLRLEQRGTGDAMVIIEIKLVHRWSYDELLDKFRSQLVDRYLISERARHGLYLLVDLGKPPKNAMPDGSKPDIAALASLLNQTAEKMRGSGGPVAVTQVFTIMPSKRHTGRQSKTGAPKTRGKAPASRKAI
jgi:hypothetical protein